jgi:hypothetical protein
MHTLGLPEKDAEETSKVDAAEPPADVADKDVGPITKTEALDYFQGKNRNSEVIVCQPGPPDDIEQAAQDLPSQTSKLSINETAMDANSLGSQERSNDTKAGATTARHA